MVDWGGAAIAAYLGILVILCVFGVHRAHLTYLYLRTRKARRLAPLPKIWPSVTVQLPLYNEKYVAERLIDAVAALDYPRECLEIQVLDDSTDETREVVAERVAHWHGRGVPIVQIHRVDRQGFKAGALAAGMQEARGEFLAIFDADFLPDPSFLRDVMPHFTDAQVGMVQTRWEHLNRESSLLSALQAILLDGHFVIEHAARHRSGRFFNFNGTAGVWRKTTIEDAGGWQGDTLTEDLDLSYRSQIRGWDFVYLPHLTTPAELPMEMAAFKSQQHRWAKGSIQTAKKLLPQIWQAPKVSLRAKVEATFHLLNNLAYPLLLIVAALMPIVAWVREPGSLWISLLIDLPILLAATASILWFYGVSQAAIRPQWLGKIWRLPLTLSLGAGLAVNNSRAVFEALMGRVSPFIRTPKYAVTRAENTWQGKKYRSPITVDTLIELALGIHFLLGIAGAAWRGHYGAIPFLSLFAFGFLYVGGLTLLQRQRHGAKAEATPKAGALPKRQLRSNP